MLCVNETLDIIGDLFQQLWHLLGQIGRRRMLWTLPLFAGFHDHKPADATEKAHTTD